jgi:hypothetical protein
MEDNDPAMQYSVELMNNINDGQRLGQAAFNATAKLFPDIAKELSESNVDPFYDDEKTDAFLDAVVKMIKG